MSDNIQTNATGRLTPCLQKKIDKTTDVSPALPIEPFAKIEAKMAGE